MAASIESFKQGCSNNLDSIIKVVKEHPSTVTLVVLGILFGGIIGGIFGGGLGFVIAAAATGVGLGLLGYAADQRNSSPFQATKDLFNNTFGSS